MEPRLLRRGNVEPRFRLVRELRLQWSHAFSDVETGQPAVLTPWTWRFNGATPSQTWKHPAFGGR